MTDIDEIIAALANRRRRYTLYCLREEGVLEVEALARRVAAWEAGDPPEDVPEEEVEKRILEFHHDHVGAFRETGCIEYDERSEMVRYRDPPEPLSELLDAVAAVEHPECV